MVYWARKSGWIVFNVKSARKWVASGGIIEKSTIMPGHWDQPYVCCLSLLFFVLSPLSFISSLKLPPFDFLFNLILLWALFLSACDALNKYSLLPYLHDLICLRVLILVAICSWR